jgi:hypothetical protein
MKKSLITSLSLTLIITLASYKLFAQSITILPTNGTTLPVEIKTNFNIPGFIHEHISPTGAKVGTVIRSTGTFLQTFNKKKFQLGDPLYGPGLTIDTLSNVYFENFVALGTDAPNIEMRKFTGVTDGFLSGLAGSNDGTPYFTAIPHSMEISKILSVSLLIQADANHIVSEGHTFTAGYEASISFDDLYFIIQNKAGNSQNILNKPFKILVTSKQFL